jgi:hypothetical protein
MDLRTFMAALWSGLLPLAIGRSVAVAFRDGGEIFEAGRETVLST